MQGSCCCQSGKDKPQSAPQGNAGPLRELTPLRPQPVDRLRYFGTGALVFAIWTGCYLVIEPLARLLTQAVPGLSDRAAAALEFFLYDTAKILLLLLLMVYVIGWLRAGLHVERVRDFLAGRRRVLGYVLGAGFGAITPFCSCSSIPLFLGFTTSGIPVGITLAFLITSPLINEDRRGPALGAAGLEAHARLCAGRAGRGHHRRLVHGRAARGTLAAGLPEGKHRLWCGAAARRGGAAENGPARTPPLCQRGNALHLPARLALGHHRGGGWGPCCTAMCRKPGSTVERCRGNGGLSRLRWLWASRSTPTSRVSCPSWRACCSRACPWAPHWPSAWSAVAASLPEVLMLRQVMRGKLLALFLGTLLVLFSLLGWLLNAVQGWLL